MHTGRFLGFCVSQAVSKTLIHFFPAADNVSAPYSAACEVRLFGEGATPSSVMIEGGRLGHPDGVWAEDAFPALKTGTVGMFGLELEITSPQPRLDLRGSGCVLEVLSQGLPVKFFPKRLNGSTPRTTVGLRPKPAANQDVSQETQVERKTLTTLVLAEPQNTSSLLLVNGSSSTMGVRLSRILTAEERANDKSPEVISIHMHGKSVQEFNFPRAWYEGIEFQECSWGSFSGFPVEIDYTQSTGRAAEGNSPQIGGSDPADELALFMLNRDATSKRLVSVLGL